MTTDDIHALFAQTLIGNYEDDMPWDAVFELSKNGSLEIFEIAAGWLKENNSLKNARAAAVLAQLRAPSEIPSTEPVWLFRDETYPLIIEMLNGEHEPMVLCSGISALGHLNNPAGITAIASYVDHPDKDVRFSVAWALANFPNDSESVSQLLTLTHDEDSNVRDWAVFGLGVLGDVDSPEIRSALLERISDRDEDVLEEALVGLGKRREVKVLPVLRSLLAAPGLKLRIAEAASAMLGGLPDDPMEWEAEDYKRALDETFGSASV